MTETIQPAWHDCGGFLWYTGHGLKPYWFASDLVFNQCEGIHELTTELDVASDETPYHLKLTYNDTQIAPRPHDTVSVETLSEIDVTVRGPGQRKCSFQMYPRYPDMRSPDGDKLSIPWLDDQTGVAVQIQPTAIPLDEIGDWLRESLRRLAHDLGQSMHLDYFADEHVESRGTNAERYVRIRRDQYRKLVDSNGVLDRVATLVGHTEGSEGRYKWDNSEVIGQRHALDLDPVGASELIPGHRWGKRIKCYHPKRVRSEESDDDPMSSPVLRVAMHKHLSDDTAFRWDELDDVTRELDETIVNLLDWGGVPSEPDPTTFRADDHFQVTARSDDLPEIKRRANPLPEIEAEQEHVILSVLDDLRDSSRDTLSAIADGGPQHWTEIKTRTGYKKSTLYQALDELAGVIESDNGRFQFASPKIRDEISSLVDSLDEMLDSATRRVERLARVELRSRTTGALDRWLKKWGAEIDGWQDDEQTTIRFDNLFNYADTSQPTLSEVLQEGYDAWVSVGRDGHEFDEFRYEAETRVVPEKGKVRVLRAGNHRNLN